jgi:hypothetical protein
MLMFDTTLPPAERRELAKGQNVPGGSTGKFLLEFRPLRPDQTTHRDIVICGRLDESLSFLEEEPELWY